MSRSAYLFLLLASDYSRNLSFLKQKYRQRVFTTTIRNPTKLLNCGWAGGWGREELMAVNSKTMAVLHLGGRGDEFLARAGVGAWLDEGIT